MTNNKFKTIFRSGIWTLAGSYPQKDYIPEYKSELELEKSFIKQLGDQGIVHLDFVKEKKSLLSNLREQIEKLNDYTFSDNDWENFLNTYLNKVNDSIKEKAKKIQDDYYHSFQEEKTGKWQRIEIINKKNLSANSLQVINQYKAQGPIKNRYDVTILVNGLPLVHIELKKPNVNIKEAFNQINRYQNDSFGEDSRLFEYVQIFVISNGSKTKYYSNTVRDRVVSESGSTHDRTKTSNSYGFTSFWADSENINIYGLSDFTSTFFSRNTLLNILTKYCIFTSEESLLVMRPYQIEATENIIKKIEWAKNNKYSPKDSGGYIWHTTGSGKTLTSFKTAVLAKDLEYIKKVLFVVDRKDLDFQTMKEYDKFQKNAANSTSSTRQLKEKLDSVDDEDKIIITTIQKLSNFVNSNKSHPVYKEHVVIIFDECHRSQFGEMHKAITTSFKRYYLFGFTGTPIFAKNAQLMTTEQLFGKPLHTYTIVNAIKDKNVLPFNLHNTVVAKVKGNASESEKAIRAIYQDEGKKGQKIEKITEFILEYFNSMTLRHTAQFELKVTENVDEYVSSSNKYRNHEHSEKMKQMKPLIRGNKIVKGFNSILAVESIKDAIIYYQQFKLQQEKFEESTRLKVAMIYSFAPNVQLEDGEMAEENNDDAGALPKDQRVALEEAINDYYKLFGKSGSEEINNEPHEGFHYTSGENFQNYYKNVSERMKNKEIDLLIVVNMFLTGFDATALNTLWLDKNLKMHSLIQAFSRTNRILNESKQFGNIVSFRNIQENVDEAIKLFGDENAKGIVLLKSFDEYYYGADGYKELVSELKSKFPNIHSIESNEQKRAFISTFNKILKLRNILRTFPEDFKNDNLLTRGELDYYQGIYNEEYHEWKERSRQSDVFIVNEYLDFEISLLKSVSYDFDHISKLLIENIESPNDEDVEETVKQIINASIGLRSKKDLLIAFIRLINANGELKELNRQEKKEFIYNSWIEFLKKEKSDAIEKLIKEYKLRHKQTIKFIDMCFERKQLVDYGQAFSKIFESSPRFVKDEKGESIGAKRRKEVLLALNKYFEKFKDFN
ncbi:type I restriction endonuclease subunit R [Mycoplasmopsis agassizii]|uniref:Type I restriction enzyme endonuclease subunit n=1 Tax=Mycoplasmopsis agassizii TaxID=33922 RepID=A0ABX4H5K6_9BACT|nr:type I restriction endonuclease subunit R [Mycoplasmopsis agassizii]PAF55092.1 hypothetical protein CJF60_00165 [Mycoplasmopsis agassizii]SMC19947.1 type I restriction enzyme, R subunit [Mycoplasmopsis agassizii]